MLPSRNFEDINRLKKRVVVLEEGVKNGLMPIVVVYIDVSGIPPHDVVSHLERTQNKIENKDKAQNVLHYFVPVRSQSKIEVFHPAKTELLSWEVLENIEMYIAEEVVNKSNCPDVYRKLIKATLQKAAMTLNKVRPTAEFVDKALSLLEEMETKKAAEK